MARGAEVGLSWLPGSGPLIDHRISAGAEHFDDSLAPWQLDCDVSKRTSQTERHDLYPSPVNYREVNLDSLDDKDFADLFSPH